MQEWFSVGEDEFTYGASRRRVHRGSERGDYVVRPQDGYNPEILSHLSPKSTYPLKVTVYGVCFWKEQ